MNLVRLGHYHVPSNDEAGYCQTALVIKVTDDATVNLIVWDGDGDQNRRIDVPVAAPAATATFHLSGDCPWGR